MTTWKKKINEFDSKKKWWELTKVKIKEISIQVSKQLSKERNIKISQLEKQLNTEKNNNPVDTDKINNLTNTMENLWSKKVVGARIRARIKHYDEGENLPNSFLHKKKYILEINCGHK